MDNRKQLQKLDKTADIPGLTGNTALYWYEDQTLMVLMLDSPPEKSFFEKDLAELKTESDLLSSMEVNLLLCSWKEHDEIRTLFKSLSNRVRALDFLNVVLSEAGLVKGDAHGAYGRITTAILWVRINNLNLTDTVEYFEKMIQSYFEDCEWIVASQYAPAMRDQILSLKKYRKKHVPWSFVKSTDIAPAGTGIRIKTLENETGYDIVSDDDLYIMIGIQGEVYHISAEKFEHSYQATEESLDIFANMTLFIPEVQILPEEEYMSIDQIASLCYPKNDTAIYARQLTKRTNVFPVYDPNNYFSGHEGDYLAIRTEDISDIYIIQKRIFLQTYEEIQ